MAEHKLKDEGLAEELARALEDAAMYPAALNVLHKAWVELLGVTHELGIPLPREEQLRAEGYALHIHSWTGGKPAGVKARGDGNEVRGLVKLLPAFVDYLHAVAQDAADALVVAEAIENALQDERVQGVIAMQKLAK